MIIKRRSCVGFERITKNYLLSVLPSRPDPTYITVAATGERIRIDSIDTINQPYNLKNGLYKKKYIPIETEYPRKLLVSLKDSDWKITSFNSYTREVCFSIKNYKFSYIIPNLFWK